MAERKIVIVVDPDDFDEIIRNQRVGNLQAIATTGEDFDFWVDEEDPTNGAWVYDESEIIQRDPK